MIEALIRTRPGGPDAVKRDGDVICVKLRGSPWGGLETQVHQLVEIDDPALEMQLILMLATELIPVITLPYAQRRVDPERGVVLARQSRRRVNLDALPQKDQIRNPAVRVPKITVESRHMIVDDDAKGEGR